MASTSLDCIRLPCGSIFNSLSWYGRFYELVFVSRCGLLLYLLLVLTFQDTFDVRIVVAKPVGHMTDFLLSQETDLHK